MITVRGKLIPATVEQVILDLRDETGLFKDINEVGDNLMVTCPSHSGGQENNPSCGILLEDKQVGDKIIHAGKVHCYTCNYTADISKLVADLKGYHTAQDGLQWLLKTYTSITMENTKRPPISLNIGRESVTKKEVYLPKHLVDKNNQVFNNSKQAIEYMENRGISKETCNKFKLGYNPYNNTIMIPIAKDNKVAFYKERGIDRRVFLNQRGQNKANYIFGLDKAKEIAEKNKEKKVWICESEIDALTIYERGDIAISIMGSQISDNQVKLLINSPIRNLIDGLDRDQAGRKGFEYLKEKTIKYGFRYYNTRWGNLNKKDINELTELEYKYIRKTIC